MEIIIIGLFLFMVVREIIYYKTIKELTQKLESKTITKTIAETSVDIAIQYMTDEKRDELLRQELGDLTYNQLVSEQNYGNVG